MNPSIWPQSAAAKIMSGERFLNFQPASFQRPKFQVRMRGRGFRTSSRATRHESCCFPRIIATVVQSNFGCSQTATSDILPGILPAEAELIRFGYYTNAA